MSSAPQPDRPIFSVPVRWTLRVLAWLAFGVAAYLAWHAVTGRSIAGCGVGSENGCDAVLSSGWSKWLGMPVAIAGLGCYATLAGLSVLLGLQSGRAGRWINTGFVLLSGVAAGASLWFIAVQLFAIGHFCLFCIVADLCGIAIGALAIWSSVRWLQSTRYLRRARSTQTGLMSLRSALPAPGRTSPAVAPRDLPVPSLPIALGGATALVALLIAGQVVFPTKMYALQQVALDTSVEMNGAKSEDLSATAPSADAQTRVALRVPAEANSNGVGDAADESVANGNGEAKNGEANSEPTASEQRPTETAAAGRERTVKLLGGKLTLDVYKHPLIGSPDAPHVMVEMVSYDCAHCRKTHRTVKQALARYGDQVAIILMVIPLERGCNRMVTKASASHTGACATARMALGVAALKPSAFPRFHDWLMQDKDKPPPRDQIIARAYSLVDRTRLRELSGGQELNKQIAQYVDLFAMLQNQRRGDKEFGLPVQILGDHVLSGTIEKPDDLYRAWEEHLGVKPR